MDLNIRAFLGLFVPKFNFFSNPILFRPKPKPKPKLMVENPSEIS